MRYQAIPGTNDSLLFVGPLGGNYKKLESTTTFVIQKYELENAVCKMSAILSQLQNVKISQDGHPLQA